MVFFHKSHHKCFDRSDPLLQISSHIHLYIKMTREVMEQTTISSVVTIALAAILVASYMSVCHIVQFSLYSKLMMSWTSLKIGFQ